MTTIEQLLREALDEQAAGAPHADADLFPRALATQRRRRRRAAGVLGVATVVGGVAGGLIGLGAAGGGAVPAAGVASSDRTGAMSVQEQNAALAAEFGITDPPPVQVVRLVVPEERGELVEQCLIARGWPAHEDGYTFISYSPDQEADWNLDNYICMSSYPIDPDRGGGMWTDAQTATQYDWTINTVLPCLDALGYTVTVPPPSRADFIAAWWTDPYYPFAHIDGFTAMSNAEHALLDAQCPQTAPTDQLWG